jgi:hypothetical protein
MSQDTVEGEAATGEQPEAVVHQRKYGSRSEVWEGVALQTRGGLQKAALMLSRTGRIVSRKKSEMATKLYAQHGFKKRTPKPVEPKKKKRRRKKT